MYLIIVRIKSHENIISKNDLKCTTLSYHIPITPATYFLDQTKKNLSIRFHQSWASMYIRNGLDRPNLKNVIIRG